MRGNKIMPRSAALLSHLLIAAAFVMTGCTDIIQHPVLDGTADKVVSTDSGADTHTADTDSTEEDLAKPGEISVQDLPVDGDKVDTAPPGPDSVLDTVQVGDSKPGPDAAAKDAMQPADAPILADAPSKDVPDLGPGPDKGASQDGPQPLDAGVDAPADAPADLPASADSGPGADLPLAEGILNLDSVIGLNDQGKYLCLGLLGKSAVCQCNDGLDNDKDGKIDFPADPGCLGPWDHTEQDGLTQCTDGIDNDKDGKIDAADPECTGPLDDDESSYGTGIPGDNKDPCKQDCFFDGNSGSGDDKCDWNLKCDPKNPGKYQPKKCLYDPKFKKCPSQQSATCLKLCLTITHNGCDCFGCCQLTYGGVTATVRLVSTCKPQYLLDPYKCPPCTPVVSCLNSCKPCEVCVGKPKPEPWCFPKKDAGGSAKDAGAPGLDSGGAAKDGGTADTGLPAKDTSSPGGDTGTPTKDTGSPGADTGAPAQDSGVGPTDGSLQKDGGGGTACPNNWIYCGPGGINPNQCPTGTFCITGCCVPRQFI